MLHRNIRPNLGGSTERAPVSCDSMCLALQYALIGQACPCIYVDSNELRSRGGRDRNGSHPVIPENVDSKRKPRLRFDLERERGQKCDSMRRYTRRIKRHIAEVFYQQTVDTAF